MAEAELWVTWSSVEAVPQLRAIKDYKSSFLFVCFFLFLVLGI